MVICSNDSEVHFTQGIMLMFDGSDVLQSSKHEEISFSREFV